EVAPVHATTHRPAAQASPAAHWFPQDPQFLASAAKSAQEFPQRVVVSGQSCAHAPREQTSPPAQTWSHAPQCATSADRSTQAEPHQSKPVEHPPVGGDDPSTSPGSPSPGPRASSPSECWLSFEQAPVSTNAPSHASPFTRPLPHRPDFIRDFGLLAGDAS